MKISKYVSKYDYLGYYCKQKAFWFFTNAEITSILAAKLQYLNSNNLDEDEDDSDDFNEDSHCDAFTFMQEAKLNEEIGLPDSHSDNKLLELYLKNIQELKNVDDDNPLIIEGRILDDKSKQHIIKTYKTDHEVVDFDQIKINSENAANKTEELILGHKNIIIFQPVFIDTKRNIITKCDALVKTDNEISIIETKGTTGCRKIHYLDLLYQKKLIDAISYMDQFDIRYYLCLVRYEKLNRFDVSFIVTDTINLTKSSKSTSNQNKNKPDKTIDEKQDIKMGRNYKTKKDETYDASYYINQLLKIDELSDFYADDVDANILDMWNIEADFDNVIQELWDHKKTMDNNSCPLDFKPDYRDFWKYKVSDFKKELRTIFALEGYEVFSFNGSYMDQTEIGVRKLMQRTHKEMSRSELAEYLKTSKAFDIDILVNHVDKKYIALNKENILSFLDYLKPTKVYFDFETINSSIRAFDDTLPFMQTVTQCSIIKTFNDEYKGAKCNNLMQDPRNITKDWFKQIVDGLYEGPDASYIVYNKNFEKTRLKEFKTYINESDYSLKIDEIINGLYDLADFFTLNKNMIFIPELHGFYSIKKVLPFIEKNFPNIFKETNCLDYKTLDIGNGLVCQQKTTKRFFNMISEKDWEQIVHQSKIYCENDVRAMIAVELFVKEIVKEM